MKGYLVFGAEDIALVYLLIERHWFRVPALFAKHLLQLVELGVLVGARLLRFLYHWRLKV